VTADRMLLSLVGRNLLLALVGLVGLFLLVDLLESVGRLLDGGAGLVIVMQFYATKVPALILQLLPVALVVGAGTAFAQLGRHLELRALAAAGLGPGRLLRPVAMLVFLVAVAMMALSQWAVPPATRNMESLMQGSLGRLDSSWRFFRTHLWFAAGENRLIRLGPRTVDGKRMRAVTVLDLDEAFHLKRRWDIGKVRWRDSEGAWYGYSIQERDFSPEGSRFKVHKELKLDWAVGPDRFQDLSGRPAEKSLAELEATAQALLSRGLDPAEWILAWHMRWSYPILAALLVFVMFPLWVSPARRRSLAMALLESAGLVSLAFGLLAVCRFSVSGDLLSPAWGAWAVCIFFAMAALATWFSSLWSRR